MDIGANNHDEWTSNFNRYNKLYSRCIWHIDITLRFQQCLRLRTYENSLNYIWYDFLTASGVTVDVTIDSADGAKSTVTPQSFDLEIPGATSGIVASDIPSRELSLQLYPSPLTTTTNPFTVAYSTPQEGAVEIRVVNMYGETIATAGNGVQSAGAHQVHAHIANFPAGFYMCSMIANGIVATRPLVIVK